MVAAQDAEDARLLSDGDYGLVLATYFAVVEARVRARVDGAAADDVVQDVMTRLLSELTAGKTYSVPFRVVVHMVTTWTIKGHFQGVKLALGPLPEGWEDMLGDDGFELEDTLELERLFADLTEAQRRVAELRYVHGLEIEVIAAELGMTRNGVDQALYRAREKIRPMLDD